MAGNEWEILILSYKTLLKGFVKIKMLCRDKDNENCLIINGPSLFFIFLKINKPDHDI
jgi:hypothetical protein